MGDSYSWAYKAKSGGVHDNDKEKTFGEMKPRTFAFILLWSLVLIALSCSLIVEQVPLLIK